jgi:nitrogenase molybdenum-iron protein alpha chain
MEVVGLKGYHYDHFAEPLLDMVENNENIVFNVATGQPFEQANLLNRLKPDLYIGHIGTNGYTAKQGFPIYPLFGQSSIYMGYQGAYEIVRRIARLLRNPSFNRNFIGNSKLPYRNEWYEQNPFTYIDDSAAL